MDDRLLFLLKWLEANPNTRKAHIKELLTTIDFHSISNQCLQVCLHNPDVACHLPSEHLTTAALNDHRVLIMKGGYNEDDVFWCLDLERDQWFRIKSNSLEAERSNRIVEMSGTCTNTTGSIVCSIKKRSYQEMSFVLLDLPKDACTKINLTGSEDEGFRIKESDNVKINEHVCIVSVNKQIKRKQNPNSGLSDIHHKLGLMSMMGLTSLDQLLAFQIENRGRMTSENITTSTLYIGHIGESNLDMSPLFSFKDEKILKFAISDNAIAIIFQSREFVALYDLIEGHLERKSQRTSYSDKIAQIKDGFVIYDNNRCITFTRMQGACLSKKYLVKEIPFEHIDGQHIKYFICSQTMYRYYRKDYREHFKFECTPFQTLVSRKTDESIPWKQLPLPKQALLSSRDIKERCFEIFLPKSMLRCHVECPHCKTPSREVTSRHTYDQDDYYYDGSSSDDDYNVPSYYN
jgi:hypothetical protein